MSKDRELPTCPVEVTISLISDKWRVLIVRDLLNKTMRFGELKKSLFGISQKVLTQHLRAMEESGLLTRKIYPEIPPRVEYSLTETGMSLKPILDAMSEWGVKYRKQRSCERDQCHLGEECERSETLYNKSAESK